MSIVIIATVGPSTLQPEVLKKLRERKVDFIRLNLSHTESNKIEEQILKMKKSGIGIILDTEGSQIRTGFLGRDFISLAEGDKIRIYNRPVTCSKSKIYIRPKEALDFLKVGSLIFIDFNSVLLKVVRCCQARFDRYLECVVVIGGVIGSNKAVTFDVPSELPPFSQKDMATFQLAKKYNITHFTLSFIDHPDEVLFFRKLYPKVVAYSKIETKKGIIHFDEIVRVSDGILIDRGDLSREISFEQIPIAQKMIIQKCNAVSKPVFVATNVLESMSENLKPMKSEVNDVMNTILDGVNGFVLTKESAVGRYPIETVNVLQSLIRHSQKFFHEKNSLELESLTYPHLSSSLIEPHGGNLINRMNMYQFTEAELKSMPKLYVEDDFIMDAEQIAIGTFSPLEGFMTSNELEHVLNKMRLPNHLPWPIPILLPIEEKEAQKLKPRETIVLIRKKDKKIYATLLIDELFKINKLELCKKWFGTTNSNHPGVQKIGVWPNYSVAGKVNLLRRLHTPFKRYELMPAQVRKIFEEKNWHMIVGFHTRNPIHRSHEYIQLKALEQVGADGLFIHPLIGKKKKGDFESGIIIQSYEIMLNRFYPKRSVLMAAFLTYPRYAGPREAIFTAICRKNFGCSHLIVGRDHAGVGQFYPPYASQAIFDKFPDLGIKPIFFDQVSKVSGTSIRELFINNQLPPDEFMRPEISKMIVQQMNEGKKVFFE